MRRRRQNGYVYKDNGWWVLRKRQRTCKDGEIRTVHRAIRIARIDEQHRTKASVRHLAEEELRDVNAPTYSPQTVTTVGYFVDNVYLPHVKEHKRPSTYKGYADIWNNHLCARCAEAWLRDVRTFDVQSWLDAIAMEDNLNTTSMKHVKHFLGGAFRYGQQLDYFDSTKANPVRAASIPDSRPASETHAYSLEEIREMLALLPELSSCAVALAAFTGIRKSELRGALWEGYTPPSQDGSVGTLHVTRSVWRSHVTAPKTEKSKAPVPVIAPVSKMLQLHRLRCGNPVAGPIFANRFGRPLDLDYLYRTEIAPTLKRSKKSGKEVNWHGWHAFRRGLATNLHRLGINDKVIQAILRHSNIGTTQNIYIKSVPADAVAAMRQLEALLCAECAPAPPSGQSRRIN